MKSDRMHYDPATQILATGLPQVLKPLLMPYWVSLVGKEQHYSVSQNILPSVAIFPQWLRIFKERTLSRSMKCALKR